MNEEKVKDYREKRKLKEKEKNFEPENFKKPMKKKTMMMMIIIQPTDRQ